MTVRQLLLVVLVLLQSGLTAGYAHAHACSSYRQIHHTRSPHVHAHQLLDLLTDADESDDEHDEDNPDAFAVSDLTVTNTESEQVAFDSGLLAIPVFGVVAGFAVCSPFLTGLPPSIAGPPRPLYLTFCALRN